MSKFNPHRRKIIQFGSAQSLTLFKRAIVPFSGTTALLTYPQAAHAWVQIAASVASVVLNYVASSRAGDGGLGATIAATLEYQRIMSQQLISIQNGIVEVLQAVQKLPEEMRKIIQEERAKALITEVASQVSNFRREYERSINGGFSSFDEWLQDKNTRPNLEKIDHDLETAVNRLQVENFYGPLAPEFDTNMAK